LGNECRALDFAVIWDEDHDVRIIPVIERIYAAGLLSIVTFIGEAKGMLTVILNERAGTRWGDGGMARMSLEYAECVGADDPWQVHVGAMGEPDCPLIISADRTQVGLYLQSIGLLWHLGVGASPRPLRPGA
jgi:hypothetical protein